jgi:hypothetical protein
MFKVKYVLFLPIFLAVFVLWPCSFHTENGVVDKKEKTDEKLILMPVVAGKTTVLEPMIIPASYHLTVNFSNQKLVCTVKKKIYSEFQVGQKANVTIFNSKWFRREFCGSIKRVATDV